MATVHTIGHSTRLVDELIALLRGLVGDALVAHGVTVLDIIGGSPPKEHTLTSFAVVDGTRVTYPGTVDAETADED